MDRKLGRNIMQRVLLLDMDGVVFHQPRVTQQIGHRITRLVQKMVLPREEQGPGFREKAYKINEQLYTKHGHTLRGLQVEHGASMSLEEFNRHVYSPQVLRYMSRSADLYMRLRGDEVARLLMRATLLGVPVYIFSNAPAVWCNAVLRELGLDPYIPTDHVLGCDHPLFQEGQLLKPNPAIYSQVSTFLQRQHPRQMLMKYFVDDSILNLRAIRDRSTWVPIWLSQDTLPKMGVRYNENRNICHALRMEQVGDYLELL